jgi:hypothetical protein
VGRALFSFLYGLKVHSLVAAIAVVAIRAVRGVSITLIIILLGIPIHQIPQLCHLVCELGHGVHHRLVGQDVLYAFMRNRRQVNALIRRRHLVIRADELKQIEENTRMAHVEAQSQVRDCHRDTPVLRCCRRLTADRRDTCRSKSRKVITRLSIQNHLRHLLGQVPHDRVLVLVVLWVQREPRGARRGWRAERCHRRGDCCQRSHDKSVGAVAAPTLLQALRIFRATVIPDRQTRRRVCHDGVTVLVILKEDVTRKRERREKGRHERRHVDWKAREKVLELKGCSAFNFTAPQVQRQAAILFLGKSLRKEKKSLTLWVFFNFTSELNGVCVVKTPKHALQFYS